jgi:hypothetical protein
MKLALDLLCENPIEKPSTVACLYHIKQDGSVRKMWLRERNKKNDIVHGGQNKVLCLNQHEAILTSLNSLIGYQGNLYRGYQGM